MSYKNSEAGRHDERRRRHTRKMSVWAAIGAIILIILLLIWLTMADFAGDTDVAAMITGAL